jgi:hypothetical protein
MTGEVSPPGNTTSANQLPQATTIADTRDELVMIHREIDALQVVVAERKTPWYKSVSTILSVTALLFSFGTTYVSNKRIAAQDIQSNHQQLRTVLQRMAALPKENVEVGKKYADDPASLSIIGGLINQENTLLVRQAAELARALPNGVVSPIEYYAIALGLQNAYDLRGAKEFMGLSARTAGDFNTEISARRGVANLEFLTGNPVAGRALYVNALNIFSKYAGYDPFTVGDTNVRTELSWAYSEATVDRSMVIAHIDNAERIANTLTPGPGTDSLKNSVMQARTMFERSGIAAGGMNQPATPAISSVSSPPASVTTPHR